MFEGTGESKICEGRILNFFSFSCSPYNPPNGCNYEMYGTKGRKKQVISNNNRYLKGFICKILKRRAWSQDVFLGVMQRSRPVYADAYASNGCPNWGFQILLIDQAHQLQILGLDRFLFIVSRGTIQIQHSALPDMINFRSSLSIISSRCLALRSRACVIKNRFPPAVDPIIGQPEHRVKL